MIKAVIYDMDDLMVNSDPLHIVAWEKLLTEYGHKFSDLPESTRSNFIGKRVSDICEEIINTLNLDTDFESFYEKRIKLFLDIVKDKLEVMPGLLYSLKLFKSNDYKIALASSGAQVYIDLVLDRFNIRDYFDVIVSGDSVKKGKPNPETYTVASNMLGFNPEECVVLEDAKNGIDAAIDAGCSCLAIINPNTPPQDQSRATLILNSLEEITLSKVDSI